MGEGGLTVRDEGRSESRGRGGRSTLSLRNKVRGLQSVAGKNDVEVTTAGALLPLSIRD